MKILLIGCKGQLGCALQRQAARRSMALTGADLPECDITDPRSLDGCLAAAGAVDVVINAAAYTAVDRAESEVDRAFAVNRDGAGLLARRCRAKGAALIHVSTDYVFDGRAQRPYRPDDTVCPLGVYGRSKAAGEALVRAEWERHVIVRTAWLFGLDGLNFVKTMLRLGAERDELRVVADQYGSPTYADDLAAALLTIADHLVRTVTGTGTYHFCNQGVVSWHQFTQRIFDLAAGRQSFKVRRILPVTTAQYPTAAQRPAYTALDCTTLESTFGIRRRPYDEALAEMLMAWSAG